MQYFMSEYGMTAAMIDNTRYYYGMKAKELTYGLCDETMIAKLVQGDVNRRLDKLLVDALMQRMGRSMRTFEYLLGPREYCLFEKRQEIRRGIDRLREQSGERDKADLAKTESEIEKHIEEYLAETAKEHVLHQQIALLLQSYLADYRKEKYVLQMQRVETALRLTIPEIMQKSWSEFCFSETEFTLAVRYAVLEMWMGHEQEACKHFEQLYGLLERAYYRDGELIHLFGPVFYHLSQYYYRKKQYVSAARVSETGRKLILKRNQIHYVNELLKLQEMAFMAQHFDAAEAERLWEKTVHYRQYKVFEELYVNYYPMWNAQTYYPIYREYGSLSLGKIIRQRRELFGMTRAELIQNDGTTPGLYDMGENETELCSISTLNRLENGQSATHWKYIRRLLIKLKLPPTLCCSPLISADYQTMVKWRQCCILNGTGKTGEAGSLFREIKHDRNYIDCPSNDQALEALEEWIKSKEPGKHSAKIDKYLEWLEYTIPKNRLEQIEDIHVFPAERNLIRNIALEYARDERYAETVSLLKKLLHGYLETAKSAMRDVNEMRQEIQYRDEMTCGIMPIMLLLETKSANIGDYAMSDTLIRIGIELCMKHNVLGALASFLYDMAWNLEQNKKQSIAEYRKYIRITYVIYAYRKNMRHIKWLIERCKKYYPDESFLDDLCET